MRTCPAFTRSPRSARIALTRPSASDEIVTWSTGVKVPTTSTARLTESCRTDSTRTGFAAASRLRAWAVSDLEQAAATATRIVRKTMRPMKDKVYLRHVINDVARRLPGVFTRHGCGEDARADESHRPCHPERDLGRDAPEH